MEAFSTRGKPIYSYNGYCYVFDKFSACGTKKFWRCERKNQGCKCRIHTVDGVIVNQLHNHSHDSNAAILEKKQVCTAMKIRATQTMEPTSQIINLYLNEANLSQAAQANLPASKALKKMIRRTRKDIQAALPNPLRVEDLVIPEEYKSYDVRGIAENFLLADSGQEPQRILIFGRERNINEILLYSDHWFVDGTFSIAPPLFSQVYVIMAKRFGGVHPVAYALLPNKQTATYIK